DDNRTGTRNDNVAEAGLLIDAEGSYGLYVMDGNAAFGANDLEATNWSVAGSTGMATFKGLRLNDGSEEAVLVASNLSSDQTFIFPLTGGTVALTSDAIASAAITDGTITAVDIATSAVGSAEVSNGSIAAIDLDTSMSVTWTGAHGYQTTSTHTLTDTEALTINATMGTMPDDIYAPFVVSLTNDSSTDPNTSMQGVALLMVSADSTGSTETMLAIINEAPVTAGTGIYLDGTMDTGIFIQPGANIPLAMHAASANVEGDNWQIDGTNGVAKFNQVSLNSNDYYAHLRPSALGADQSFYLPSSGGTILTTNSSITSSQLDLAMNPAWTGAHDFGGASSLEVPNSAGPSLAAAGQIAVKIDGAKEQLFYYGTTTRVLSYKQSKSTLIAAPTADNESTLFWYVDDNIAITKITCIVDPADGDDSVVIGAYQSDVSGDFSNLATNGIDGATTITCDNDGASDDGTLSNPEVNSGKWVGIRVVTGDATASKLVVNIEYRIRWN
ncbi:MAG: hypothetical protein HQM16_11065, partial [Deltaproteobacteria bacterium]|nr:hypothetical protein [Deltaproteobacteria bacterium]